MKDIKQEQEMTEQEVRRIAREESQVIFEKSIKEVTDQILLVKEFSQQNQKTLARLERLLLGEMGVDKDDTLKARATFAYQYAKRNTDLRIVERAVPALEWFEDMNTPEKGSKDCKLDILGKIITSWTSIKWLGGVLGVVNVATFISLIILIMSFLKLF